MTQRTRAAAPSPRPAHRALALLAAAVAAATTACGASAAPDHDERRASRRPPAPALSAAGGSTGGARPFTLVASGDVLPHSSVIRTARADAGGEGYDFAPMLAGARPVVSRADLAICHMETVYGANGDYTGYPTFKSPPQVATGLKATGYDACSTASNHTLDAGTPGIHRTLAALDKAGIKHAGSGRTAAEGRSPAWLRAGGAKVAQLSYTYGTNDIPLPKGRPWSVNLIDRARILADARAARTAGADVVVVSLHWGTEWQDAPDRQQLRLSRQLTASRTAGRPDVDLILGTHAHVPQAYQKVNGTWVIYGMGDQIAGDMINHEGAHDPRGNQGTVGRFTFAPPTAPGGRWEVTKAEFVPHWFDTGAGRVVNLNAALDRGADVRDVRDRIRRVVLSRGAAADGLVMGK
ncbi:Capsule biosynthesis protein CapA [Streptomyces sp. YIM 121038]|uniref:CapA family protein n=1 Tax=Streptomyces sp. YIM 121038 TaxID=2136401 RepID=UPI001162BE2D|nr:CapA family protein [Streptomyces sp. YIM 121038]QCX80518.1 Capsule biosynthesis protein CapA [Streptomyces sp. YIM 121038]